MLLRSLVLKADTFAGPRSGQVIDFNDLLFLFFDRTGTS